MASTCTYLKLKCKCGEEGKILCRENDSIYTVFYEEFLPANIKFNSNDTYFEPTLNKSIFEAVKPSCIKCNEMLTKENIC